MAAEYPNISKGPISPPDVWIQKNTCCVTQWSWSLCHDPKKYVTQRDHGFSVGGRGWFKNRLEGLSRWKNWMHFLSTFVQLPKKKIPLPFNWLVLSDDLNEQKRPFSPIIQRPKWATGYGLSTFPRKNGTLSSRFSPGFFGFCQGTPPFGVKPLHPSFQEEMKTPEEGGFKRVDFHPGKTTNPKKTYQKQNLGGGFIYFLSSPLFGEDSHFD